MAAAAAAASPAHTNSLQWRLPPADAFGPHPNWARAARSLRASSATSTKRQQLAVENLEFGRARTRQPPVGATTARTYRKQLAPPRADCGARQARATTTTTTTTVSCSLIGFVRCFMPRENECFCTTWSIELETGSFSRSTSLDTNVLTRRQFEPVWMGWLAGRRRGRANEWRELVGSTRHTQLVALMIAPLVSSKSEAITSDRLPNRGLATRSGSVAASGTGCKWLAARPPVTMPRNATAV
jgi:hypothetical protein